MRYWTRWRQSEYGPIGLLLALFILLGLAYSIVNPLHEATDELRHYRYVRHIVEYGQLPVQGVEVCRSQSHHPPLFYGLGALLTFWVDTAEPVCYEPEPNPFWQYRYWEVGVDNKAQYLHGADEAFPWYGGALIAHLLRGLNVLIGAGVVAFTWAIGRRLWPDRPVLPLAMAALIAFNPMFLYLAGAINNDIIAALGGVALTWAGLALLQDPNGLSPRWGVIIGSFYGLALMAKFNLAAFALPLAIVITYVAWRRRQGRAWLQTVALIGGLTALLSGWWFWRNWQLYGDLTGFTLVTELWGVRDPLTSLPLALSELPYAWTSLWGRFGFGQIPLPEPLYLGLRWLVGLGLAGWLAVVKYRPVKAGSGFLFLLLVTVVSGLVLFNYMLVSPAGPMGRFFFPGLPALAGLIVGGYGLLGQAAADWRRQAVSLVDNIGGIGLGAGLLALALVALFGYLAPAYARPPAFAAEATLPNPVNAQFDTLVNLRGYEISSSDLTPGEFVDIKLYWEVTAPPPGDYLLFVHLIDEAGTMVAQRDTHPGLGNFPARQWRAGDRFVESLRLYIPETAYTPATAQLSIGLYAPGAYRLGLRDAQGNVIGDALTLGQIDIAGVDDAVPNRQNLNFNNQFVLLGYEYDQRVFAPGEALTVSLGWELLTTPGDNYKIRLELYDASGGLRARVDRLPQEAGPSYTWTAGQTVWHNLVVPLPPDLPTGNYDVHLTIFDNNSQARQPIVAEDGHYISEFVQLARIHIDSE